MGTIHPIRPAHSRIFRPQVGNVIVRGWKHWDVVEKPPAILDLKYGVWLRPWPWWKYITKPMQWKLRQWGMR